MASFDTSEIKKIILFKELGLVPEGQSFEKDAVQKNRLSVLMTDEAKSLYLCGAINENSSLAEIRKAFVDSGGRYNKIERQLTSSISDSIKLRSTLLFFKDLICEREKQ
jgi:hypothetical protein